MPKGKQNEDNKNNHNVALNMNRPSRIQDPVYATEENKAFQALEDKINDKKNYLDEYIFEKSISIVIKEITDMLMDKNKKYGNSALNPVRIFSKADSIEQIKVRIDDKLSRISNAQNNEDEDVINDLIGYLILLKIAKEKND